MTGLTDKQSNLLGYIEEFMDGNSGMAPTVYELAERFGVKTSTIFAHLRALQRKGFIDRSSKARSISLKQRRTGRGHRPTHMSFVLPVPILGRINAGLPAASAEYEEGKLMCSTEMVGAADLKHLFALRIIGESMRDMGMLEDDLVVVDQSRRPRPGDVVAALIDNECTVKSFYPLGGGRLELRPANPEFKSQVYPADEVAVQGVVVCLQRKF